MTGFAALFQFVFHLTAFLCIAFVASMFVLPFLTLSFILSSATVGLSFASRMSFEVGIFFYDRFVLSLQSQLRGMVDQMPPNHAFQAQASQKKTPDPVREENPNDTADSIFQTQLSRAEELENLNPKHRTVAQTLGSTVPLQSIEESLLDHS